MRKINYLIIILSLLSNPIKSEDIDYSSYHKDINKAEKIFFIYQDFDSSLFYYDKAFLQFDFIFVKDLVNAAQIAFYAKKPYRDYLIKGFEFGLKIKHLEDIKLFNVIYTELENDTKLKNHYTVGRKKYLEKIDFDYLLKVYHAALKDQVNNRFVHSDTVEIEKIAQYKRWMNIKGFPGAKLIGIEDETIFAEIGKPQYDIQSLKKEYGDKLPNNSLNNFSVTFKTGNRLVTRTLSHTDSLRLEKGLNPFGYFAEERTLTSNYALYILIHHDCAFYELEKELKLAIKQGEIHPREVGTIYDDLYRNRRGLISNCPANPSGKVFRLNFFCSYCKSEEHFEKDINTFRNEWDIVSLEVDRFK
jgi:hypothetical protein